MDIKKTSLNADNFEILNFKISDPYELAKIQRIILFTILIRNKTVQYLKRITNLLICYIDVFEHKTFHQRNLEFILLQDKFSERDSFLLTQK